MNTKRFFHYFLSMTMIASLLFMTSCGEDEVNPIVEAPSFLITGVDAGEEEATTAEVGEEVAFDVNVTAPGGFNRLVVEKTVDGTTETVLDTARTGDATTTFMLPFSYTPTAEEAGQEVIFDFFVVDDNNLDNTYTYTVNVNEAQVATYSAVLLAAPTGTEDGTGSTSETFFSTSTGEIYSVKEVNDAGETVVSDKIDFGYFYGQNMLATIASPAAYPYPELEGFSEWTVKNETVILPTDLTESEFIENGVNAAFILDTFEAASAEAADPASGKVSQLEAGDVLVFKTDAPEGEESKYGLIVVNGVTGTDGLDDYIDISVKVTE